MKKSTVLLAVSTVLFAGVASADSAAAMTSISTEAAAMIASAWPIITTIVVAGIAMKLFKKFANKAS